MAKQYHGDDTIEVIGGLFVAVFQFVLAIVALIFVGAREIIRRVRRR